MIFLVIWLHFIGDFIFQSDWMAQNKSKSWGALAIHSGAYIIPFVVGMLFGIFPPLYVAAQLALHFAVDAVTSRINAYLYPRNTHWFFVGIGFDQAVHLTLLIGMLP